MHNEIVMPNVNVKIDNMIFLSNHQLLVCSTYDNNKSKIIIYNVKDLEYQYKD